MPNGQCQPGHSGNPNGRPRGLSLHQSTLLIRDILQSSASEITQAVIAEAKRGNPLAQKLCLDRIAPAPSSRTVNVDLPAPPRKSNANQKAVVAEILQHHSAVLHAVAVGTITPDEGERMSHILDARRRTWESTQLADRLTALEDRAAELAKSAGKSPKITWMAPRDKDEPDANDQIHDDQEPEEVLDGDDQEPEEALDGDDQELDEVFDEDHQEQDEDFDEDELSDVEDEDQADNEDNQ